MEAKKKYFMDCHLAGKQYHDADEVWDKLKVNTELKLVRDKENKYDPDAVAVVYRDEERQEDFCIGYIPGSENKEIATILEMGWHNIFECRISSINEKAHPEQQIYLTIKVKRNAKEA